MDSWHNINTDKVLKDLSTNKNGLSNAEEREYVNPNSTTNNEGIKGFLTTLEGRNIDPQALEKIKRDPSKDDYHHFLDPIWEASNGTFLERFKEILFSL